jgi:hypothetical protein
MSALPIAGYAKEYTDARQLLADIAARKRRMRDLRYVPPAPPPVPVEPEPEPDPWDDFLKQYRLAVDTFDPVVDFGSAASRRPLPSRWVCVVGVVSAATGVGRAEIEGQRRTAGVVYARRLAFWLMRTCTPLTTTQIGRLAGGFDHTTVMYACQQVKEKMAKCEEYRREVEAMRAAVLEIPGMSVTVSDKPISVAEAA